MLGICNLNTAAPDEKIGMKQIAAKQENLTA